MRPDAAGSTSVSRTASERNDTAVQTFRIESAPQLLVQRRLRTVSSVFCRPTTNATTDLFTGTQLRMIIARTATAENVDTSQRLTQLHERQCVGAPGIELVEHSSKILYHNQSNQTDHGQTHANATHLDKLSFGELPRLFGQNSSGSEIVFFHNASFFKHLPSHTPTQCILSFLA
jgi:hypothetical protein